MTVESYRIFGTPGGLQTYIRPLTMRLLSLQSKYIMQSSQGSCRAIQSRHHTVRGHEARLSATTGILIVIHGAPTCDRENRPVKP